MTAVLGRARLVATGEQVPAGSAVAAPVAPAVPRRGTWVIPALILLATLVAVGLAVPAGYGAPAAWALPVLGLAVAVSELAVVHFSVGQQRWTLTCTDGLFTVAFALAAGSWVVLAAVLGVGLAQLARRQAPVKSLFNVVQFGAATAAGAFVAHIGATAALPRLSQAAAAMTAVWLVQTLLVAGAVAATSGRGVLRVLRGSAALAFVHTAASVSIGLLAAWLSVAAPAGLPGLLVPVVLLWASFAQTGRRSAEALLFAELARGQEQAGGGSLDVSARVVLTAAAKLLGGADVEMLVFASEGLLRYVGSEEGSPTSSWVDVEAMAAPWIPAVLAGGVVTSVDPDGAQCGVRIGPAHKPLALLRARRAPGTGPFGGRDIRLARVLVAQAETWLSVADLAASRDAALQQVALAGDSARALGDLGADTAPSLWLLRESAGRLMRLAQQADAAGGSDPTAVSGIVEELQSVERAVASLLGAVALAAEPDLLGPRPDVEPELPAPTEAAVPLPPAAPPRRAADDDWVSSGVLS